MKIVIIISIAFVLLIPVNVFAIDFVDSSGYIPSWARDAGYHTGLARCVQVTGDLSDDADWCLEWMAYVLDQGIENFPESATGISSTSNVNPLSERVCTENKLCAFPGEFLKYKNTDSFDDFSEIAIVEFKEKTNDDTIRVFIDGFGTKPLTYDLNLNTGIETHDEYKNVNRPFNLIEPIPMKIGQKVSQYIAGYYGSTLTEEVTKDLGSGERVFLLAKNDFGGGEFEAIVYDKETGVLIRSTEVYKLDGIQYVSDLLLIDSNIFSVPTKIISTKDTPIPEIESQPTTELKIEEPFFDMPGENENIPEIKTTQSTSTPIKEKSSDSEVTTGGMIFAAFVVFVLPIIIIGLIIWKLRQRKARKKNVLDVDQKKEHELGSDWKGGLR